ncbi:MAG: UvrD-helicase domain-containing protein, partial [Bdellovibrionia bacterium]
MEKRFSPEQTQVLESWGQGMAVLAGAGSGKTTTLVEKCVRLIRRNPQAQFAAVSFTERSANDLKIKLSAQL